MKNQKPVSMKVAGLALALALCAMSACGRKPSYSDIDVNRNQAAEAPAAEAAQPSGNVVEQAVQEARPPAAPDASQATKIPAFFDSTSGQIKDLPDYPEGRRTNILVGPIGGVDSVLVVATTSDPVEKVGSFYDKAAKSNGWTVAKEFRDAELVKLELRKPPAGEGLVEVRRDAKTNQTYIKLSRIEKPAASPAKG